MRRTNFSRAFVVMPLLIGPAAAAAQHSGHQIASPQGASAQAVVADCARAQPQLQRTIDAANLRLEAARQSNSPAAMRAAVDDLQGALGALRAQLVPCAALQAAAPDPHAGHAMPGIQRAPAAAPASPMMQPASPAPAPAAPMDHSKMPIGGGAPAQKPPTTSKKPPAPAAADPHAGHAMPKPQRAPAGKPAMKPAARPSPAPPAGDPHAGHAMTAPAKEAKPERVMDPVTGLMVDPKTAPQTTYHGQTYYFSSEQAREEFLHNPAKYARKRKQ